MDRLGLRSVEFIARSVVVFDVIVKEDAHGFVAVATVELFAGLVPFWEIWDFGAAGSGGV